MPETPEEPSHTSLTTYTGPMLVASALTSQYAKN